MLKNKEIIEIIPSNLQTKEWRQKCEWYYNGKSNECEKYQIDLIEKIIKQKLHKTHDRINMETNEIIENKHPMKKENGYEWTENFDGKITINKNIFYFNLKFVCDSGGSQTRTLREVYHFIKHQMKYLIKNQSNVYFINILDGDTSYNNMDKFKYLYKNNDNKYIFIGSLYEFQQNLSIIFNQNFLIDI